MVYMGFGTIHRFRHPLRVLEHTPENMGREGYLQKAHEEVLFFSTLEITSLASSSPAPKPLPSLSPANAALPGFSYSDKSSLLFPKLDQNLVVMTSHFSD